jgi:superfamily II DNA or RNA helicase
MNDHGIEYRDYQEAARNAAFDRFTCEGLEDSSSLVVMPTGTGKTVLAGMCVERAIEFGWKTLFIAHREVLIEQAENTMSRFGFNVAREMGAADARKHAATAGDPDVVVASIQTMQDDRLMRWEPGYFRQIITDECHRSLSDSYTKLFNWFGGYHLLGITATPRRGDERNLGARYKKKVYEYPLRQAIQDQWLVPIRTRECRVQIDLRGLKLSGGDFSPGDLSDRIGPKIEALARAFLKEVGKRPFVFFAPDVGSAMAFADVVNAIDAKDGTGVKARYVAGVGGNFGMSKAERKANLAGFNAGECQGLVCNELLVEGWDCPKVEAVGIGRPTKQQYRFMQMVGRGTRPSPATGKVDCLVVDFDWETDADCKDICSTVDIFDDGSVDEEVFAIARSLANSAAADGDDVDPLELIEEAERIIRTRRRFGIVLTGKEAAYAAVDYDPVGVAKLLDIKLNRKYDLDKRGDNPASQRQLSFLRGLGLTAPDGLSKWGASKMIDKIQKRKEQGLASVGQVKVLLSSGVNEAIARQMTGVAAGSAITEIVATKPKTQTRLFT